MFKLGNIGLRSAEANHRKSICSSGAAINKLNSSKTGCKQRNAIEGTISELARAHDLRISRYRGFAKVELQNLFIGTACNIKRWLRIVAETKSGSNTHILPFRNGLYRIRGICGAFWMNWNSFS